MHSMPRCVMPEVLDHLNPEDPRASRSRRDLQRVHRAMGSVSILRNAIESMRLATPPKHIVEIGAGDGTLLLRLARALQPPWAGVEVTLLDQQELVSAQTRLHYEELGWHVTVQRAEVMTWARQSPVRYFDLCLTSLFLHHFDNDVLARLLHAMAARVGAFVACEPRRNSASRWGGALVGLLGANAITREDAVTSVAAGFAGSELTALWPVGAGDWVTQESLALPFSHCFTAVCDSARTWGSR